jgi:hypothetical protein
MKAPSVKPVRCAIYTRVSTDHGLDQEFNSLDAQYDAASAYIKSQAHAAYSLSVEKTKLAFRSAYSLLDKVAFFLNDYLKLDIPLGAVSFRSLWFVERGSTELRPVFTDAKNWPLRGLYWLAKDFVERDFQASTEPDARDVAKIRNHLEHRYLKVRDRNPLYSLPGPDVYDDRLALSVERQDLDAKALRILKLARAAMIHLCLAMHREKNIRAKDDKSLAIPMTLPTWKRRPKH